MTNFTINKIVLDLISFSKKHSIICDISDFGFTDRIIVVFYYYDDKYVEMKNKFMLNNFHYYFKY